jgi:hypothetical protein
VSKSKIVSSKSKKSVHTASPATVATTSNAPPAIVAGVPTPQTTASPPAPLSFADRVTAAVSAIAQAKSLLSLPDPASVTEVKHAVKFKKGGEQYVPTLAVLSARYGVEVPSRPTSDMTAQLEQATQLEPARAAIGELASIVEGAYFSSRSETWTTATSLYSMLKKGGAREPKLAAALTPMTGYFANRHPSVTDAKVKTAPVKAADKAQVKVQKRISKLQAQLLQLQNAQAPSQAPSAGEASPPGTVAPTPTTEASAPAPVVAATHAS